MNVLHHTAPKGAHGHAPASQVTHGFYRRFGKGDKKNRTGVGWRDHAQRDPTGKRRYPTLGPLDPVGGHEAEFDLASVEAIGVIDARQSRLNDALPFAWVGPVEKLGDRQRLGMKGAAGLRGADS